jgi:amidase
VETALTLVSATHLARLIRDCEVSAVEVLDAHLARIDELNPTINAVITLAPDARDRAAEADRRQRAGAKAGPLHGVPFTVKDIIDVSGLPTTLGLPEHAESAAERDATMVARLRAAGAILIGKTNCPPGGSGGDSSNELFGRTLNPYDIRRIAGGSSGGEAAAIASGMSPIGLGSDSGGSLRMPAHFCGIATLKPTAGLLPLTGVLDVDGQIGALADPRTQPGPLARHVEDLVTLLPILAGPDTDDAGVAPVPLGDPAAVDLRDLRVIVHALDGEYAPDAGTSRALEDAAEALVAAGARRVEASLPAGGHELTERVWASYRGELSSLDLYELLLEWDRYRTRMLTFLATGVDLVLTPVAAGPAPSVGAPVDFRYTTPFSLTGWPCAVVRAGQSDGMPVGVQLVAGPWQDHVALAAAAAIELELGGWQPPLSAQPRRPIGGDGQLPLSAAPFNVGD